ncbi:MAG TPA: hypothetical protein VHC90_22100 [Bryobacteraceae bacterium]|nr:hypothetical protein [Bryobacteraceae bacterium]
MPNDVSRTARVSKLGRIQRLKEQQAQLAAKIKDLSAREAAQARKDDTRRKIIVGALALEHMEKNPDSDFARRLFALLDEYARPMERRLFEHLGLGPATDAEGAEDKRALKREFPG